jgi:hypothetical protein
MSTTASSQLEAIHAMLATGHRSIRMDRHTLVTWGLAGGLLCIISDILITPERFPEHWQGALAIIALLGSVLFTAGVLDFNLTRRLRRTRDESLSFVHRQIYKVWWLLLAMGVLLTFGMEFFGGGYMVYGIWLVLIGLGLYIHGLFSEQLLEWSGVLIILLGVAALVANLPYEAMRWLAASTLGLGLPLLAFVLNPGKERGLAWRLLQVLIWLVVVLGFAAAAYRLVIATQMPDAPTVPLATFRQQSAVPAKQIVSLPAGTRVALQMSMQGNVVENMHDATLPMILAVPLDVVLIDGKPDGRFRLGDGPWRTRLSGLQIRVDKLAAALTPGQGSAVNANVRLSIEKQHAH